VRILTLLGLLLLVWRAWASPLVDIDELPVQINLGPELETLASTPDNYWPSEVANLPGWQITGQEVPGYGIDGRPRWFRISLRNDATSELPLMLEVANPHLDRLDIFQLHAGKVIRLWSTGLGRGIDSKPYPSRSYTVPLTLKSDERVEFYFRVESRSFLQFPLKLSDVRTFTNEEAMSRLLMGLLSGVFLLAGAYALLLFGFIRERRFIYYSLFCFSLLATSWSLRGYLSLYSSLPSWVTDQRMLLSLANLLLMSLILSSIDMFRIWLPQLWRYLCRMSLVMLGMVAIAVWFSPLVEGLYLTFALYTLVTLQSLLVVVYFFNHGSWLLRVYAYSWLGFMAGCMLLFSDRFGWLNQGVFSDYLLSSFAGLAATLLAFSLAYRTYQEKAGRLRAKRQASEGLKRYFDIYHSANEGLFTSTLEGQLLAANPAYCRLFGFNDLHTMSKTAGRATQTLYANPRDRDDLLAQLLSSAAQAVSRDVQMRRADGTVFWARLSLRLSRRKGKSHPILLEGILVDITESKEYQARLEHLASHDEVTDLFNRRYLIRKLEELLTRRKTQPGTDYLCLIDIDHFKVINEAGGHQAGDEFLQQIAHHLDGIREPRFLLTRVSSDQFAVLMENTYIDEAIHFAERWRKAIASLSLGFGCHDRIYSVTASLGLVSLQQGAEDVTGLLALADAACVTAKRQGRNRIHLYSDASPEMRQYQEEGAWAARLNQALAEGQFVLARQAIVPSQGQTRGLRYEILLRLRGEQGQLILPEAFMGAGERFGLMPAIDFWVIETLIHWYDQHPDELLQLEMVSVNLSAETLRTPKVCRQIQQLLQTSVLPGEKLCFELEENKVMASMESTRAFISSLKALGCHFALDRFGSGFSSCVHLKTLNVDWLKIDGQFIQRMDQSDFDRAIVRSMAELARAVGIQTVATCVENDSIRKRLEHLGVDYLQGYALSKPTLLSGADSE